MTDIYRTISTLLSRKKKIKTFGGKSFHLMRQKYSFSGQYVKVEGADILLFSHD